MFDRIMLYNFVIQQFKPNVLNGRPRHSRNWTENLA